jgi:hypothetical protein
VFLVIRNVCCYAAITYSLLYIFRDLAKDDSALSFIVRDNVLFRKYLKFWTLLNTATDYIVQGFFFHFDGEVFVRKGVGRARIEPAPGNQN